VCDGCAQRTFIQAAASVTKGGLQTFAAGAKALYDFLIPAIR
jgi:hypothetical protein